MKIEKLSIDSPNLEKQRQFYGAVLGLPVTAVSTDKLEVQVGYSVLEITHNPEASPYHIAFHISAKTENEALKWLKKRVGVLKLGDTEIIDFSSWNAQSLYFYDADHNIVEFISRRHLHRTESKNFSAEDICGIAEIGLATEDVEAVYDKVQNTTDLEQYSGDLHKFCPIGDDKGLFITIDKRRKKTWFPTDDRAQNSAFTVQFCHRHKNHVLHFDGKQISIT